MVSSIFSAFFFVKGTLVALELHVLPEDFVSNVLPFLKSTIVISRWETLVGWLTDLPGVYALYKLSSK